MPELMLVVEFDIPAGCVGDFKAAAAPVIEATSAEPGTLRYDWHLSEDGLRDLNLERFEDAAAFVIHDRHVAPIVPPLNAVASLRRFCVMGDPSDDVRAQLAAVDVQYYRHLSGIERQPGGAITLLLDLDIKPGRLDEFTLAARALVDRAAPEPGTLGYDFWISEDQARVRVTEVYANAAAFLAHDANAQVRVAALLETCTISGSEVVGDPGEARAALVRPTRVFFSYFSGIAR